MQWKLGLWNIHQLSTYIKIGSPSLSIAVFNERPEWRARTHSRAHTHTRLQVHARHVQLCAFPSNRLTSWLLASRSANYSYSQHSYCFPAPSHLLKKYQPMKQYWQPGWSLQVWKNDLLFAFAPFRACFLFESLTKQLLAITILDNF